MQESDSPVPPSSPHPRRCLKCGRVFPSEGIHQRICRACKRTRTPDEVDPDEPLDSEASRARREQGLRRLMGLPLGHRGLTRFVVGLRFRFESCQWIVGEPTGEDACKCGRPISRGGPYCERHEVRAHLRACPGQATAKT